MHKNSILTNSCSGWASHQHNLHLIAIRFNVTHVACICTCDWHVYFCERMRHMQKLSAICPFRTSCLTIMPRVKNTH